MKIHWRTEDRWLREFREEGKSFAKIAREVYGKVYSMNHPVIRKGLRIRIEDAIRRAILRRERKKRNGRS